MDTRDKKYRPSEHMHKPIGLCFESELEEYLKIYTRKGAITLCHAIEAELEKRQGETRIVQQSEPKPERRLGITPNAFTEHETETILKYWQFKSDREIAKILNCGHVRVSNFRNKRGLYKTAA